MMLLHYKDFLLFAIFYHPKLIIFEFWTCGQTKKIVLANFHFIVTFLDQQLIAKSKNNGQINQKCKQSLAAPL